MKNSTVYTYFDSKKIYFTSLGSKYMLVEKKQDNKSISLISRNTVIMNKNGIVLFSK